MTSIERAARLERIRNANIASNNRVHDFIDMIAKMCAETTAHKKHRGDPAPSSPSVLIEAPEPFVTDRHQEHAVTMA